LYQVLVDPLGIFGGGGGTAKAPTPTAPPPLPAMVPPIEANTEAKAAGNEERRRRAAASGRSDTILTGGQGLMGGARVGTKTLLGE
jgi:hypothetical protein